MKPFDIPSEPRVTEMAWPTRIVFGAGALQKLPAHAARLNMKRPLLVTDAGVVKAGLAARVADVLKGAGLECAVFDRVEPNPTERDVFAGLEAYRAHKADGIVALGGGSALDAGKLVQLLTTHEPPLSRYDDAKGGDQYVRDDLPPLIAIPTTAGTGSEVGRSGVVTLADTGRKTVIFSPHLLPKAAVIDPELTLGLPPSVTAATGMDALTHCIEAYVANGFHPLADAVAIDGVMRVGRSLVTAVQEGRDLAARTDMMVAAMEGAMAFQKGLGASHALAHALTPISNVPHGLANAIVLPAVMEFNRAACTARLARIATALGDTSNAREEVLAANAIDRVRKLAASVGIPTRLREAGVQEKDLEHIAQKAFQDASHQGNPRTVTEADLLAMAREAY
ncbi:iron-containing alcohol dehydrogenase [Corallococcus exiguus]|uniref:iron-containing alcohol dehydrogenase n=1 Tax=Corallococcus TaxID=83461 RepID=UPI000EA3D8BC|nr:MULTISPECIES: iron-containing alcohol dehydrogenase [Corallococcus]NNB85485.1 iron-containing alcohol dehydrogenase [Corallococcus exiguus]NNB93668.1 iron-containing alcohol dehydrogenase [Corallococcus exiguus]NNC02273.1 iron-containing alcohol dehydrogenase [Corallococcus exiguus]RKH29179.1 iron-containing alcohol dehydrogenase [Corallococcus sp. CA041A]